MHRQGSLSKQLHKPALLPTQFVVTLVNIKKDEVRGGLHNLKIFPCFFLSCKANARVQRGPHSSHVRFTATSSAYNSKDYHSVFESQKAFQPQ